MSDSVKIVSLKEINEIGFVLLEVTIKTKNLKVIYRSPIRNLFDIEIPATFVAFIHQVYSLNSDKIITPQSISGKDLMDMAIGLELATDEIIKYFSLDREKIGLTS